MPPPRTARLKSRVGDLTLTLALALTQGDAGTRGSERRLDGCQTSRLRHMALANLKVRLRAGTRRRRERWHQAVLVVSDS